MVATDNDNGKDAGGINYYGNRLVNVVDTSVLLVVFKPCFAEKATCCNCHHSMGQYCTYD